MPIDLAICLHGRLGTFSAAANKLQANPKCASTAENYGRSVEGLARFAASSFQERVIDANRRAGRQVSVYLHSWNPEVGKLLDGLYLPRASLHEPPIRLDKVSSQHLSMKRVLQLLGKHTPELLLVSRYDLIFYADLPLDRTLLSAELWFPQACITIAESMRMNATRALCGFRPGITPHSARSRFVGRGALMGAPTIARVYPGNLTRFVPAIANWSANWHSTMLDYFFVARRSTAESFAAIYDHRRKYDAVLRNSSGPRLKLPTWSHFYWAAHVNHFLPEHARVGFLPILHMRDFTLTRRFWHGVACVVPRSSSTLDRPTDALRAVASRRAPPPDAYLVRRWPDQALVESPIARTCPADLVRGDSVMCPWDSASCLQRHPALAQRQRSVRRQGLNLSRGATQSMSCFSP